MLDLATIREHPDQVKAAMVILGAPDAPIDRILALDVRRRALLTEVESLKAERNRVSKEIGKMKEHPERSAAQSKDAERETHKERMRQVGDQIAALDKQVGEVERELNDLMLTVPNLPDPSVPPGRDESENRVSKVEGEPKQAKDFGFDPLPHWDLGVRLGIIDFERGVKISGSRFYLLTGAGARLQRALIAWMIDVHVGQGYTEVYPPYLVKTECLIGTGQLPKFAENQFRDETDDLWMIPTAEVPVTNMYRDEILDGERLPIYHVAYTACFRREPMSAGRDTRGIKRGHQFDKVEMVKFCTPETSSDEFDRLLEDAEETCRLLKIPHRVVQMVTGDLSFAAARKCDVEMWAPGCGEWLEVSSVSNFKDFQARRANIKFRRAKGAKPEFVHTLNGSGLGLPRTLIAVMENYQQKDGSIVVPDVLRPYMGGLEVIR
ncbi:MAG TPA: serine--tRNA ligase [Anaerolineae bacterium]|nr:serine--tRNA ligase [Anaerolineae bacterium]